MEKDFVSIFLNEIDNGGLDGFLKTALCKFYEENGIDSEDVDMDKVIDSMRAKIIEIFTIK